MKCIYGKFSNEHFNVKSRCLQKCCLFLGNHAQALAFHGGELNIPVTVVMPIVAPIMKVIYMYYNVRPPIQYV